MCYPPSGFFLATFGISVAFGVAFGLGVSLVLKHSSLNHYPLRDLPRRSSRIHQLFPLKWSLGSLERGDAAEEEGYNAGHTETICTLSTLARLTEIFIFIGGRRYVRSIRRRLPSFRDDQPPP